MDSHVHLPATPREIVSRTRPNLRGAWPTRKNQAQRWTWFLLTRLAMPTRPMRQVNLPASVLHGPSRSPVHRHGRRAPPTCLPPHAPRPGSEPAPFSSPFSTSPAKAPETHSLHQVGSFLFSRESFLPSGRSFLLSRMILLPSGIQNLLSGMNRTLSVDEILFNGMARTHSGESSWFIDAPRRFNGEKNSLSVEQESLSGSLGRHECGSCNVPGYSLHGIPSEFGTGGSQNARRKMHSDPGFSRPSATVPVAAHPVVAP